MKWFSFSSDFIQLLKSKSCCPQCFEFSHHYIATREHSIAVAEVSITKRVSSYLFL